MQVKLSKIAKSSLQENIEFLEFLWTDREIIIFLQDVKRIINDLENGRYMQFQKSTKNTRSVLIGKKHVKMYFRKENEELIRVLLFFEMRQNPQKIIELLK